MVWYRIDQRKLHAVQSHRAKSHSENPCSWTIDFFETPYEAWVASWKDSLKTKYELQSSNKFLENVCNRTIWRVNLHKTLPSKKKLLMFLNPAPVKICVLSHYSQGLYIPGGVGLYDIFTFWQPWQSAIEFPQVVAAMSFLSSFVTPYIEDRKGLLLSCLLACTSV